MFLLGDIVGIFLNSSSTQLEKDQVCSMKNIYNGLLNFDAKFPEKSFLSFMAELFLCFEILLTNLRTHLFLLFFPQNGKRPRKSFVSRTTREEFGSKYRCPRSLQRQASGTVDGVPRRRPLLVDLRTVGLTTWPMKTLKGLSDSYQSARHFISPVHDVGVHPVLYLQHPHRCRSVRSLQNAAPWK